MVLRVKLSCTVCSAIADSHDLSQTWSRQLVSFGGAMRRPKPKLISALSSTVYIQQILVIHLEERRKDHVQMFAHHIITTLLMSFSYVFNYTRVGNAILCTMDLVDIILSVRPASSNNRHIPLTPLLYSWRSCSTTLA